MIEWGSVAEWASGIGSIAASLVALYLAGAEQRARRRAEHPHVNCTTSQEGGEGWHKLRIAVENPGPKIWRLTRASARAPRGAVVVDGEEAMVSDEYGGRIFNVDARDRCAAAAITLSREIGAAGSVGPSWIPNSRGDRVWHDLFVRTGGRSKIQVDLMFESAEPSPEKYVVAIKRNLV